MTRQLKTVAVEGVDYAVVGYFQPIGLTYEDEPSWVEIIDPEGFIIADNLPEVPSEGEVEKLVLALKRTQL